MPLGADGEAKQRYSRAGLRCLRPGTAQRGRERRARSAPEPSGNQRGPRAALNLPPPRPGCLRPLQAAPTATPRCPRPLLPARRPCGCVRALPAAAEGPARPASPVGRHFGGAPPHPSAPSRARPELSVPPHASICRALREGGRHRELEGGTVRPGPAQPRPGRPAGATAPPRPNPTARGGASAGALPSGTARPAGGVARPRGFFRFLQHKTSRHPAVCEVCGTVAEHLALLVLCTAAKPCLGSH